MRKEFPAKVRKEAYEQSKGICADCKLPIQGGCEFDHILPLALGGLSDAANCAVVCRKCHRAKTSTSDIPGIAKAERIRQKHLGIYKSRFPMRRK